MAIIKVRVFSLKGAIERHKIFLKIAMFLTLKN